MIKNEGRPAIRRLQVFFEMDDPTMLFYKQDGINKFFTFCIWGEHNSYSVFVGTWEGSPPDDPVFTDMTEYRYGEDEGNAFEKKVGELHAEAMAANGQPWKQA